MAELIISILLRLGGHKGTFHRISGLFCKSFILLHCITFKGEITISRYKACNLECSNTLLSVLTIDILGRECVV